jgi:hypothetical protein
MAKTDKYRHDHNEMLQLLGNLTGLLNERALAADASEARSCVSKLLGKLALHLASEDKFLYPELTKSADPALVAMARTFAAEMSKTAPLVLAYGNKWPTPSSIKVNPKAFIDDTRDLAKVLTSRIQRENTLLYAAADKADLKNRLTA